MNRRISRLGAVLLFLFGALFIQLNVVQVVKAKSLNNHVGNVRPIEQAFSRPRGTIVSADGTVLAQSVAIDDPYRYLRVYPTGDLFGQITGYFTLRFGASGIEREYNAELSGRTPEQQFRTMSDLFTKKNRSGNLRLTIRDDLQQTARDALGDRKGSVVVLDPRSGDILAAWSYPSFDPNPLSAHGKDPAIAQRALDTKRLFDNSPSSPLRPRFYRQTFFPGSTFKVVTGSNGVESGQVTQDNPSYPMASSYTPPQTRVPLRNYGGEVCGGTLFPILAQSCNSAFAQMGVDLGPRTMIDGAERFGFNSVPPIDLPDATPSQFPKSFVQNIPALAQSSIGQYDVRATPLQMALVAAAVANKGHIYAPHLLHDIRDSEGNVIKTYKPSIWRSPISEGTAATMRQAMLGVVANGTAVGLQIPGYEVGGKTGTAELGTQPPTNHAWIISFAGLPGQDPAVVVAVLVEGQPGVASEQTGGAVAAPVAKTVLEKALSIVAPKP